MYKTKEDYRAAWKQSYENDPPVPLNVDIELASLCNLACPFCFWGEAKFNDEMMKHSDDGKIKKRLMPTEMAMRIIDQAAAMGVPALKFNWRGESTLHPDYSYILSYASLKGQEEVRRYPELNGEMDIVHAPAFHDLLVNTNANCKDHALDGLMAATKCMVSLDSTIPDIYKKMRVNGRLERATEVVRELIRRGHKNLWIRRVITKDNVGENFKENVDRIFGGSGYFVSEHHCMDRGDTFHAVNNPARYERTYCGYPSQRIMVAADGTCYPCCVDTDGTMPMGKFGPQTLAEIWEGEPFKKLRAELRVGKFCSGICQKCESWMAYKAPQRENVQDKAL